MNFTELCDVINFVVKKGYEVDVVSGQLLLIKEGQETLELNSIDELLTVVYDD